MKAKNWMLSAALLLVLNTTYSQLATLPAAIVESYKDAGWVFFKPSTINSGQLFTTHYSCFFTDTYNTMVVDRTWSDNWLNLNHKHYAQYYNGIRVEGRGFIEHYNSSGKLVYANGKICSEIGDAYISNVIGENAAIDSVLLNYEYNEWSWDSPAFEAQYKEDLEDTLATSYPSGELIFTTKSQNVPIEYDQNSNDYVLAWKFELYSLVPSLHFAVYVDASTGEVIKTYDLVRHDGPATIPLYGSVTLDTRWLGSPTSAHVLHTNDGGREVHTKYDGPWSFGVTSEVEDDDGSWGTSHQSATAAHWSVSKAWDYFAVKHGRDGLDGSGGKVRVLVESTDYDGAWYGKLGGIDRIFSGYGAGGISSAEISILAHEFTHGINEHSGVLEYKNESGALDESFADIFGFLVRKYASGSTSWEIGIPTALFWEKRNLQTPKLMGYHYEIDYVEETADITLGQPDTYGGEFWLPWETVFNDAGGVHVNSGVQNHWFYMLCNGEIGTNDNDDDYIVFGIDMNKAAEIAYYNLTTNMEESSQYEDAMIGAVSAAEMKWGECSFEHIQTKNAWYAAGVGESSSCYGSGLNEDEELTFTIYPNPAVETTTVSFTTSESKTIQIYASNGMLLKTINNVANDKYQLNVSNLAKGSYIISVRGNTVQNTIFIKE
jgi:bacillolysin